MRNGGLDLYIVEARNKTLDSLYKMREFMLRTAVQRANEILPALTHCFFVCDTDETLVRMHQWYKFLRKACTLCFIAFVIVLTIATSTSVLLYQVCMPSCCIRENHMFCMSLQVVTGRMYAMWHE